MDFFLAMCNSGIIMPLQKPSKAVFEASQVRKGLHIHIDHTAPFSSLKLSDEIRKVMNKRKWLES